MSPTGRPKDTDRADPPRHGPREIHAHLTRPVVQQLNEAGAHSVLELGCGSGWFSGALDRCGFDVSGADRDEARLRLARQHQPRLRFHRIDPMADSHDAALLRRFDAVVAIDLVDRVPAPRRLIATALALLRPGGLLVVSSTFHGYSKNLALALTGRLDVRWDPLLDDGRTKCFSRATLTALLSEFALNDMHYETVGRIPMFARAMLMSAHVPG